MRYRPAPPQPNLFLLSGMLLCMVLFMITLPRLVFAMGEGDPLPRYTLTPKEVGAKVAEAIVDSGIAQIVEATIDLEDPHTVYGADEPIQAEVNGLQADARNKRWSANILFKNGDKVLSAIPMQGRFQMMVELPALKKTYKGGEIIQEGDLIVKKFPAHYSKNDVIASADTLIGKAARRNISADRPIREQEISAPMVLKKNDIVQMNYSINNLHITTSGQVLADAAVGDMVEVRNTNSNQVVRALVNADKTVSVQGVVQTSALGGIHATVN